MWPKYGCFAATGQPRTVDTRKGAVCRFPQRRSLIGRKPGRGFQYGPRLRKQREARLVVVPRVSQGEGKLSLLRP